MCKRSILALLASALLLTSGLFVNSCQRFDPTALENRVSALEGLIDGIKAKLEKAITTGSTVTAYDANARKITLSDGTTIELGSADKGGEATNIKVGEGYIIITIAGVDYILPMVSSVNSVSFVPTTETGIVPLDNDGAVVYLHTVPALSEAELALTEFSIADAREIVTKAGESLIKIVSVELEEDLIKLTLKGLGVKAATTYVVSVKLDVASQYEIASDYFYVKVDNDFYFAEEELVEPTFSAAITDAVKIGEKQDFWVATLPDGDGPVNFLNTFNFKDFVTVEGDVTYELAPKENQNDAVKGNYDFFKACLAADGTWTSQGRPGTNCAGPEEKPGILILLKVNDVVKTKVYFKIVDPFANLDFKALGGLQGIFEAELYARSGQFLAIGENEIDIPAILNDINNFADDNEMLVHQGKDNFFPNYLNYEVRDGDISILYNDGEGHILPADYAKRYITNDDLGVFWYYRGFMLVVPEDIAPNYPGFSGGEGYDYDTWGSGDPSVYANQGDEFYMTWRAGGDPRKWVGEFGITLSPDGILRTDASYTGWGVRLAFAAGFQYAYGVKDLCAPGADQLGMVFFNRRKCDPNATMPNRERE